LFEIALKEFCGKALNQSGNPRTAGIGRGKIFSISGGQRNFTVTWFISSIGALVLCRPILWNSVAIHKRSRCVPANRSS
jgi:hypothetical protein